MFKYRTNARLPSQLPPWVADCLANKPGLLPETAKCSFFLEPAPGSGLPPMPQPKLTAPRILRMSKVRTFVASKAMERAEPDAVGEDFAISCNGTPVGPEMSLASVQTFIWKRGEDIRLQYSRA